MYDGYRQMTGYTLLPNLRQKGLDFSLTYQLMPHLLAWGNNLTGNLDPASRDAIISSPRRILEDLGVEEIVWSSWTSTIGRGMSPSGFGEYGID